MKVQALAMIRAGIDLIWPPQCLLCTEAVAPGGAVCPGCWPDLPLITGHVCDQCGAPLWGTDPGFAERCDACLRSRPPWARGRAAMTYERAGRRLVLQLKHADRADLAGVLAARMYHAGQALFAGPPLLIVPVPLHRWRFLRRRYNQAALLARALAGLSGWPCCPDLLVRRRATRSQDGLNRAERAQNLSGALTLHPRHVARVKGQGILLIDDVLTTGATFAEATRQLQVAGAGPVHVLSLARVMPDPLRPPA